MDLLFQAARPIKQASRQMNKQTDGQTDKNIHKLTTTQNVHILNYLIISAVFY